MISILTLGRTQRVLIPLRLMNKQVKMTIKNVCPEIMDVFEVTGFIDDLNIE